MRANPQRMAKNRIAKFSKVQPPTDCADLCRFVHSCTIRWRKVIYTCEIVHALGQDTHSYAVLRIIAKSNVSYAIVYCESLSIVKIRCVELQIVTNSYNMIQIDAHHLSFIMNVKEHLH